MTEEEYFRKTHPDSCYGDRLLSPYWDFFQDGVEFGERQSEKKIEVLEKENKELEEKLKRTEKARDYWKDSSFDWRHRSTSRKPFRVAVKAQKQLAKATELLKWALHADPEHDDLAGFDTKWNEAEQFIKEIEND